MSPEKGLTHCSHDNLLLTSVFIYLSTIINFYHSKLFIPHSKIGPYGLKYFSA